MSEWNIAAKTKDEQERVAVDLVAASVAYKDRMNMPVVAEVVAREQPEELREYFNERVPHYRQISCGFPAGTAPATNDTTAAGKKA